MFNQLRLIIYLHIYINQYTFFFLPEPNYIYLFSIHSKAKFIYDSSKNLKKKKIVGSKQKWGCVWTNGGWKSHASTYVFLSKYVGQLMGYMLPNFMWYSIHSHCLNSLQKWVISFSLLSHSIKFIIIYIFLDNCWIYLNMSFPNIKNQSYSLSFIVFVPIK